METSKDKKLSNQEYKFVCEILWGCVPIDRIWAEGTKLFEVEAPKILTQYPMLDKSLFESLKWRETYNPYIPKNYNSDLKILAIDLNEYHIIK